MEIKDESRLLALPLELVVRITDALNDEWLPSLRLTCKTLEGATFDRFTKTFQDTSCCIYLESRWLSLKRFLNGSARLAKALRSLTFTSDPLENHCHEQVHMAPGREHFNIHAAQKQFDIKEADEGYPFAPLDVDNRPSLALISSVLLDIQDKAPETPDLLVSFELADTRFFRDVDSLPHKDILTAIATTNLFVGEFIFSRRSFDDAEEFAAHLSARLLTCIPCLHSFTFQSTDTTDEDYGHSLDEDKTEFLVKILQTTGCLFRLHLEMAEYRHADHASALTSRLLFANNLADLEHLFIESTDISETNLLKAIASCSANMKRIFLISVKLTEVKEGWSSVLRSLSGFSELDFLSLGDLTTSESDRAFFVPRLDFSPVRHALGLESSDMRTAIDVGSKEVVSAVLKELVRGSLRFTKYPPLRTW